MFIWLTLCGHRGKSRQELKLELKQKPRRTAHCVWLGPHSKVSYWTPAWRCHSPQWSVSTGNQEKCPTDQSHGDTLPTATPLDPIDNLS